MANPGRLSPVASVRRFFAPLALALLVVSPLAVSAQDNANGANSNNVNQNANVNTNANTNANANTDESTNTNTNQNDDGTNANVNLREQRRQDRWTDSRGFFIVVSLIFAAVLIPFGMVIYRAIRFSKSTFNSPLGLPEGSLRAILAYMLVTFVGFYVYASVLSFSEFKPPEFLLGIVATVVGFYFGSRSGEDRAGAAARTGTVHGDVKDQSGSPAVGATVVLSQVGVTKFTQTTDATGDFTFLGVPVGVYDITATLTGHGPSAPATVTVAAGAPQTVSLQLT